MSLVVGVELQLFHDISSTDTDSNQVSLVLLNMSPTQCVKETTIASFTADYLSTYLSLIPSPSDAVLSFGPMDFLLTSAPHYLPSRLYSMFPHPAQDPSEKRKYISMLTSRYAVASNGLSLPSYASIRNADVPRALVRDMYTKSWSAFDRLVSVVPPGGSIGFVLAMSSVSSLYSHCIS